MISLVGDQFQVIALALLVLDLPAGAAGLGSVLLVQALPRSLLTLMSGVAIDRFRARQILLASNLSQALVVGVLCLLSAAGALNLWHLYFYALTSGIALAFSYPAGSVIIPDLLATSEVRSANALMLSVYNLSRFLVPPIATWVIATSGFAVAFGVNTGSFLVATYFILLIREPGRADPRPPSVPSARHWARELREGLRAAREDEVVGLAVVMSALYSFGYYGTAFVSLPAFTKLTLGASEAGIGLLYSALGAGALSGAVLAGGITRLWRPGIVASLAVAGNGAALVTAGLSISLWVMIPMLVLSGGCGAVSAVIFFSLVQARARASVRGRILALYSLAIVGMYPLSFGLAGMVSSVIGARATVLAGGAIVGLAGVLGLCRRALRETEIPGD